MVRKPVINSLEELQARKQELRLDMELAKREFAHSVGTNRENIGNFLVKKVAVPVGGTGLALFTLGKLFGGNSGKQREIIRETKVVHEYPDGRPYPVAAAKAGAPARRRRRRKRSLSLASVAGLAKVIIPLVQAIIGTITAHKAKEHAKEAKHAAQRS